ncbi:unnamed protein product [Calicophoron daubneyi]|uniref:Uncharacterized protein n=1 Tax=Calicophoron daubneyi TaxID=300641 RepID=A0AAV2T6Y1_CALDB
MEPDAGKSASAIYVGGWEISDLLAEEDCLSSQVEEYTSPSGYHHVFISSKSTMASQALYLGRHIDRLLYRYHSTEEKSKASPGEIWLHGLGPLAIQRVIELALHLQNRMYPGRLQSSVQTSTCSSIQQAISVAEPGVTRIVEREQPKSAIHVKLHLLETRG